MKFRLGCATYLVVLAVVGIVIDRLTSGHLPNDLRFVVLIPASLLVTMGLSNVWMLVRGYGRGAGSRAAVISRARTGEPPPQDGLIVATGVVRADGGTLRAPLSGIECVAYEYRLYVSQWTVGSRHRETPIYWGYASRPFLIDSPKHAFRVIAVPQLADAPTQHDSSESRARAAAYVAATRYELKKAIQGIAASVATTFGERVTEPSGESRHDWQAEGIDIAIDKLRMEETVVPVGATVSVSGRWSAERRAIVPGELGETQLGVTLVTGPAEELGRGGSTELPFSVTSVAVTAALFLIAGASLVWLAMTGRIAEWWRLQ